MDVTNLHTLKKEEGAGSPLSLKGCVIALGLFDGVHRAHRLLLEETVREAKREGLPSAVFTFREGTLKHSSYLTSDEEKCRLFAEIGLDYAIIEDFAAVRSLSPVTFMDDILAKEFSVKKAVCGYHFRFGLDGIGTPALLAEHFPGTLIIPAVTDGDEPISSTAIRKSLAEGDLEKTNRLLGRPFSVTGTLQNGILFSPPEQVLPANAVYPVRFDRGTSQNKTTVTVNGHMIRFHTDPGDGPVRIFFKNHCLSD